MIKRLLYKEFIEGRNIYEHLFMLIGILLQVFAFVISNDTVLSLVSGIAGIFSVVLCSQRKYSYFIFAWIQMFTYTYIAYQERLYGEVGENVFYMSSTIVGMFIWYLHYNNDTEDTGVEAKHLTNKELSAITMFTVIAIGILYSYFRYTDDSQPFMDSVTTVPAVIAQILMITRYREQWIFWLIIDVASIWMWVVADNWIMVVQFIFWTINCIYGFIKWPK